jgi:hypothetical protein
MNLKKPKNRRIIYDCVSASSGVILHVVPYDKKPFSGFSKQIFKKYPECYQLFFDFGESKKNTVETHKLNNGLYLANCFLFSHINTTENKINFLQFNDCINRLNMFLDETTIESKVVYVPYKLGLNLCSSEWKIVEKTIMHHLNNSIVCINKKNEHPS